MPTFPSGNIPKGNRVRRNQRYAPQLKELEMYRLNTQRRAKTERKKVKNLCIETDKKNITIYIRDIIQMFVRNLRVD